MNPITTAVLPVAGLGSRLLSPATPGPREMILEKRIPG